MSIYRIDPDDASVTIDGEAMVPKEDQDRGDRTQGHDVRDPGCEFAEHPLRRSAICVPCSTDQPLLMRDVAVETLRAEVAGLRTQLAAEKQRHSDHMHRCAAFVSDITPRALKAEGQVAAIRALHRKVSECYRTGYDHYCAVCITAPDEGIYEPWPCPTIQALDSLVASSPTTPEATDG